MPDTETSIPSTSVDQLQFQHAEALPGSAAVQGCAACRKPILSAYFLAVGRVVCPTCADKITLGTAAPPASSLGRAVLYGAGAAIAGCAIYAIVSIVTGMQIGLIAILVGIMVGKAIRSASGGRGGRPQQILAVTFTYFAITTSYIPVFFHHARTDPRYAARVHAAGGQPTAPTSSAVPASTVKRAPLLLPTVGAAAGFLILLCAAAPFLSLFHGSGIFTFIIIILGLSQAWKLTGQAKIRLVGPYQLTAG